MKRWIASLGLVLAACASSSAPSTRVRALDDLPPRYQAVWEAFRGDDPGWPELRAELRADPELCAFVVDNLVREMLIAYGHADLSQLDDAATRHFRRARAELLLFPERSSEVLSELLGIGNGSAVFLAAEVLREIGRPAIPAVRAQLESASVQGRQWSARLLTDLPHALEGEDQVLAGLMDHLAHDEDWLTRAQCAQALGRRGASARATAALRRALSLALEDPDPAVRMAAATGLADLDDPDAIPDLIDYFERARLDGAIREYAAAEKALRRLTGARAAMDTAAWRHWWRTREP